MAKYKHYPAYEESQTAINLYLGNLGKPKTFHQSQIKKWN